MRLYKIKKGKKMEKATHLIIPKFFNLNFWCYGIDIYFVNKFKHLVSTAAEGRGRNE